MNLKGVLKFDDSVDTDHVIDAIHDGGFGVFVDDLTYDDYWGRLEDGSFEVDIPENDKVAFLEIMNQFPHKFV
mgnify:CR=1 FL=1